MQKWLLLTLFISLLTGKTYAQGVITLRSAVLIAPSSTTLNTPVGYGLYVSDGVLTERLRIATKNGANWADYVFKPSYRLTPLPQVKRFIEQHGHLPQIPSATQVAQQGIDVADTQRLLLQKIEELTLHAIRQEEELKRLRQHVRRLEKIHK